MGWSRGYHGYVFLDPKMVLYSGPKSMQDTYIDIMHAPMRYHYAMDDCRVPMGAILRKQADCIIDTYDLAYGWNHRIE